METLLELRVLVLRSNRLNGDILSTSTDKLPFPKLQVLDVSLNQFTGSLPSGYLSNLRAMTVVEGRRIEKGNWFSNYQESIVFVLKGVELPVMRILQTFTTVDLSGNRFSGTIPESIGNLNSLRYLNLSRNNITGNIPSSLGNMSILESLDLSSNQLVGEIPSQLTSLTFLSLLNLSFNNLVGQIPQSSTGQFPTFDNSSYMGNSGLCGFPLTKMCGQNEVQPLPPILPQVDDFGFLDGFGWQAVVSGYGCGFVFGTTIGYFIFRYGRPKWFVGLFFNVQ
ncbi:PREDICTED: receptor-like protein 12 [Erythranthe guttata]|nr:PREDICTED: receptor-like protein 12 [Erythranthe guttata]|eukprot:XP_012836708.1 PREDICTED: receptor-like protein 12 [Erythranthe guttata]